jgi:hypothetical protein
MFEITENSGDLLSETSLSLMKSLLNLSKEQTNATEPI